MDDERLTQIETEKQNALDESNSVYSALLADNDALYAQQQEYASQYETTQNEILDQQLAYQEQEIEKQKETARENKAIEDRKALNDYTAFNNKYGYEAESLASNGLLNSGVSETSKLGSYNTYQNRLASANKALQEAITEYDSAINEARLNNDVQKAENALTKLQMQLEYAETYYSNKSTISQNQLANNQSIDSDYYNRYQTEYQNIQDELAQEEAIRQFNETLAFQKEQAAQEQANWEKEYELSKASLSSSSSSSSSGSSSLSLTDSSSLTGSTSANGVTIVSNPYTGTVNEDAQYGVFSNGYQPNNVGGESLSKSGYVVSDVFGSTAYGSSGDSLANQNIWKTSSGNYYVWDGSINDYVDVTTYVTKSIKNNVCYRWGG